jgi:hypothetical protein
MKEDHGLQVKQFREEFEDKMSKKEADHAATLAQLE